jgi:hypothetical protein
MKKRVVLMLLGMLMVVFVQAKTIESTQVVNRGDSLTVHMQFESSTQKVVDQMLENNTLVTTVLSNSLQDLTVAIKQGIEQSKLTKMDIVANQLGVSKDVLRKAFKRNNTIILLCLIPALLVIIYSLAQFLRIKGLDVKKKITSTALMTVYSLLCAGLLYVIASLIFNQQYFVIKNLLSALF